MEVVIPSPTKRPRAHVRVRAQAVSNRTCDAAREGKNGAIIHTPRPKLRRVAHRRDPAEPDDNVDEPEVVVDTPQRAPKAKPQPQPKSETRRSSWHRPASTPLPAIPASLSVHTSSPSSSPPPSLTDVNSLTGLPLTSLPAQRRPALGSWCRRAS